LGTSGANAGELLQDAFTALGIATALRKIADGFIECANASIEFESAITGVYKTVDGTDEQLAKISDDIKLMSLEIPSTTTEIAGVAESAGQLGIATEDVTDFTKVMINLGEATNLSSDEAASSLAKFSNITGMAADNYENLGSTVVALGNNFATTEADIVAMATRMASAGTLAGMTESDILGLSAAMSSVGIEAEAGGSAMSKLMTDMQVAVETGNDSLEDFASVAGMTSKQFADAFQNKAVNALYAFIDGLNDVERNGETATVILENMGITEVRLSNAVKSLATNSEGLADAVDLAGEAWDENTALANEAEKRYSTLESRLTITKNAANNLKVAIGDVLPPAIGEFADTGTNVLNWMTGFVEEHPKVTAGITAGAVALGVLAVGIGGFTLAVNIAKPAVEKLTIAMTACPLFLPLTVAAGLTAGVIAFTKIIQANQDTVEDYNGTLEQCRTELDNTQRAYDNVCKMYGSNSDAAKNLAGELDTLNAQYEKGGGFIADYEQRLVESQEALDSFTSEYSGKMDSINKDWQNGLIATAQLEALSNQSQITNSDLDIMKNYADYLNDTFNCDIKVNYETGELTGFDPNTVTDKITDIAAENRKQAAAESVTSADFTNGYIDSLKAKQKIEQEYTVVRNEILKSMNDISAVNTTGYTLAEADEKFQKQIADVENQITEYENTARDAFNIMGTPESVDGFLDNLENMAFGFESVTDSAEEAAESLTKEKAVSELWSSNEQQITELANAYNDAYTSIRSDLDGIFGLFEEAKMNLEETLSLDSAISNLESQIDYFNQYEEAVNKLSEMKIDNNIIEQLDPEQAVAFAQELGNLESIDPAAAEAKINELNGAFDKLSEAKDKTAESMADVETEFSTKLDEMQKDMENAIDGMELDDEAKEAARNTMDGYINQLKASGNTAISEAASIAAKISAALNSVSTPSVNVSTPAVSYGPQENKMSGKTAPVTTVPTTGSSYGTSIKIPGNADGTPYADPGLTLVGEEGPELVRFSGGEQVYTAEETMSVIMLNPEMFPTFNAYAKGTQSAAPGVALVGEEGPELVVMNGGERVFTAGETERIFNNYPEKNLSNQNTADLLSTLNYDDSAEYINNYENTESFLTGTNKTETPYAEGSSIYVLPKETFAEKEQLSEKSESQSKDINLNINGSGSISVKSDMSKEQVVSILTDYLKPVLMNIVEQECFEEGESSYEI
ncbi:MAG: phage tail tape measure protein, partial [Porcipelethomonas sp.]